MTPAEFRAARHRLGLSAAAMARALGIGDGRTIRRYEAGECDIPGPVRRLVGIWLDDRCPDWAAPVAGSIQSVGTRSSP
jgi:hypothetical protein